MKRFLLAIALLAACGEARALTLGPFTDMYGNQNAIWSAGARIYVSGTTIAGSTMVSVQPYYYAGYQTGLSSNFKWYYNWQVQPNLTLSKVVRTLTVRCDQWWPGPDQGAIIKRDYIVGIY